jgi:hypothetical protein
VFATNLWEVVERSLAQEKQKKENELTMSSRAHSITHLVGLPTSQVPPSYVAPFQQKKASPHPSEEGRGSQPLFRVEEREREEREAKAEVVVGEKRARNRNRSGITCGDMRPKSPPPFPRVVVVSSRSVTMHGV